MKNKFLALFIVYLLSAFNLAAQSDHQLTQDFKERYQSLLSEIKAAEDPEKLDQLEEEVTDFRNEYKDNKQLLDKALYPDNFDIVFNRLRSELTTAKTSRTEIKELRTEVKDLNVEVEKQVSLIQNLTSENEDLFGRVNRLRREVESGRITIDSLNSMVADLRENIRKRDDLIMGVIDSLFLRSAHSITTLNDAEKQRIITNVENENLLDNIKILVSDNIRFLEASSFNAEDLGQLKNEYENFDERWNVVGPQLIDIYAAEENKQEEVTEIDSLLSGWEKAINSKIFTSINEEFRNKNLNLVPFTTGEEFYNSVLSFIDDGINNVNNLSGDEAEETYELFENVWEEPMESTWLPILIENNLITQEQIDNIDTRMELWEDEVEKISPLLMWSLVALAAIVVIVIIVAVMRKKRSTQTVEVREEEDPDSKRI